MENFALNAGFAHQFYHYCKTIAKMILLVFKVTKTKNYIIFFKLYLDQVHIILEMEFVHPRYVDLHQTVDISDNLSMRQVVIIYSQGHYVCLLCIIELSSLTSLLSHKLYIPRLTEEHQDRHHHHAVGHRLLTTYVGVSTSSSSSRSRPTHITISSQL